MRIIVAGAGALGSLFGGYLARAGEDVLLMGRQAHVEAIQQRGGLRITGIPGDVTIPVHATTRLDSQDGPADLVILGAKSQDIEDILQLVRPIVCDDTQILSPQNGVVTEETVANLFGRNRSLPAVTPINVRLVEPGHLFHGAENHVDLGRQGEQDLGSVQRVVAAFNGAGFITAFREDIMQLKWRKLAVYCIGSIVNALTGLQRLGDDEEVRELMRNLAEEMIAVIEGAQATEFPIRPLVEDACHHFETFKPRDSWLASVGQDLRKGKSRTEIDFLTGYIVRLGRQCGVSAPVHQCIYTLVKSIEKTGYLKQQTVVTNEVRAIN